MPGDVLDLELAGLDRLDVADATPRSMARRLWRALWPKLAAVGAVVLLWQCLVWAAWRPEYVLPSPTSVLRRLGHGPRRRRSSGTQRCTRCAGHWSALPWRC